MPSKNESHGTNVTSFRSILKKVWSSFQLKEKVVMAVMIITGLILILGGIWVYGQSKMVTVASSGGRLTEGVIGSPRFINPLLAISDTDKDLTSLIYSGLMRIGPEGSLIPDLAESYNISDDGLTYTFTLRPDLVWHDGRKLTARDVVFTILRAQDENTRSHKRAIWDGVSVEQSGERTIVFRLARPYAPFLENMTMGILPTHLWTNTEPESITFSDLNTRPVGSGPYKIHKIKKDKSGIPVYYDLRAFKDFSLGEPMIRNIRIRFYPNENELLNALNKRRVDSAHSITPNKIQDINLRQKTILTEPLPRIFSVFFNQNQADIFTRKEVRQALDLAIPREKIVEEVLKGYGLPLNTPVITDQTWEPREDSLQEAESILTANGWRKNENGLFSRTSNNNEIFLRFDLNTTDNNELKEIATLIKEEWQKLGAEVELKVFESGTLNQTVIRPRRYDSLFFGTVTGRYPDPYAFWHSSQRLDPGLNIALYANITTDRVLENLRLVTNPEQRREYLETFIKEIQDDIPASFVYAPKFIYVLPDNVNNVSLSGIAEPADRFSDIYNWYQKTQKIWPIFADETKIIED